MEMPYILKQRTAIALLAIGSLGLSACASMSKKEQGAATGAAAGAVIGHQMDQQAKEIDASVPGATVERVGEGIQVTFASGLLFPYDSDVLQPAAPANLTELANSLKKYRSEERRVGKEC